MADILYYEILDIPLPELQGLKTLRVTFHHATNNEVSLQFCTHSVLATASIFLIMSCDNAYLSGVVARYTIAKRQHSF